MTETRTPTTQSLLIVDSDPSICRVFEAKLAKSPSLWVTAVTNAMEAWQKVVQSEYQLLLWDLRLRETDEMLPRIRALCPTAPLLVTTTDNRPHLNLEIRRLGVADTLIKPFSLDTLNDRVLSLLTAPLPTLPPPTGLFYVGQWMSLQSPKGSCHTRILHEDLNTFQFVGAPRVQTPPDFDEGLILEGEIRGEDALYTFNSPILRHQTSPIASWIAEKPSLIERIQRRTSNRVAAEIGIVLHAVQENSETKMSGNTYEIGGGGCSLVTDQPLMMGSQVYYALSISNGEEIRGEARVIRAEALGSSRRYRYALHFLKLSPDQQEKLNFFCAVYRDKQSPNL